MRISVRRAAATWLVALSAWSAWGAPRAAEPVGLAVFELEFDDRSAGGGIVAPDPRDSEYLRQSVEEARRLLAVSGRYRLVDTAAVEEQMRAAGGPRHCNGCERQLALKLGADQGNTHQKNQYDLNRRL